MAAFAMELAPEKGWKSWKNRAFSLKFLLKKLHEIIIFGWKWRFLYFCLFCHLQLLREGDNTASSWKLPHDWVGEGISVYFRCFVFLLLRSRYDSSRMLFFGGAIELLMVLQLAISSIWGKIKLLCHMREKRDRRRHWTKANTKAKNAPNDPIKVP